MLSHIMMCYVIPDMASTFSAEPDNVTAYMGDVVMFSCKIDGIPHPTIVWLKDDREISASSANFMIHKEEGILEIRTVQFTDFGRYRCVVATTHLALCNGTVSFAFSDLTLLVGRRKGI